MNNRIAKSKLPLRDRKKAKLREALATASLRLFLRQGYTATTLEQICAECDVTVPTLLRYFPTKEDLLFAQQGAHLERCGKLLVQAAANGTVVEVWLQFLRSAARGVAASPETTNMYKIIVEAPTLLAKFYAIIRQYKELLEIALCNEAGNKPGDDLHAHLLAQLLTAGPVESALRSIKEGSTSSMIRRMDAVSTYILENFGRPERSRAAQPKDKRSARARS